MPFIPHTDDDIKEMLDTIGVADIGTLFDEIPLHLRANSFIGIPDGASEMALARTMAERARQDKGGLCFMGAGAYDHHIPAAVWDITTRGEFMTAYTPYQAEASQGTLQLIYEYQSMIASLLGMDIANASLYDGATALAEAVLMAVRANRAAKSKRILLAGTLHPAYRKVVATLVGNQQIILEDLPYCRQKGCTDLTALDHYVGEDIVALIIPQPNFFGVLEPVDELTSWAREQNIMSIGVVNPVAMALLKEPGQWGERGVDIACGEGQPLGIPLASGGPYFGFMACKKEWVRQMPGRIVGCTVDREGKRGFALTLQAREQHIRRSKATSNICTNQGLAVIAATIHMSILGADGLRQVALASHQNTRDLLDKLTRIAGVERAFMSPYFHEVVLKLPLPAADVLHHLTEHGILGGYGLTTEYPHLGESILVCATEMRTEEDRQYYANALEAIIHSHQEKMTT